MSTLSKTAILASIATLTPKLTHIEPLGGDVYIKNMSLGERTEYSKTIYDLGQSDKAGDIEATVFKHAVVNKDGEREFDDIAEIKTLPPSVTKAVNKAFVDLNFPEQPTDDEEQTDLKNS